MALKNGSSLRETTISYLPLRAQLRTRYRVGSTELGRRKDRVTHAGENGRNGVEGRAQRRMDELHSR